MSDLRTVLGRNIREARERLGLRQEDLAKVIGAGSSQIISQIEKGGREVKAWELYKISNALHVEYQDLLSDEGPHFGPAPRWRKEPVRTKEETEAKLRLRSQRYRQVMELAGVCTTVQLPWQDTFDVLSCDYAELEDLASAVGKELELGDHPADRLFSVLEDKYCVMIFYQDLEDGSAVSVRGPYGPAMLLNSREPPWRRNFSCAHELFHLLTWNATPWEELAKEPKACELLEKHAEAFASALLLPRAPLVSALQQRSKAHRLEISDLIRLAREFGVSTAALLWRIQNPRLISRQTTEELLSSVTFKQADRATMSEYWWTPPDLPKRYVELAFVAHKEGKLSSARLADVLETDLSGLPALLALYGLNMEFDLVYEAEIADS